MTGGACDTDGACETGGVIDAGSIGAASFISIFGLGDWIFMGVGVTG